MVLIYFGTTGCADSDFPLIRALQSQGIDVYSYFYVDKYNASSGLFNIRLKHCNSIIPAYKYEGLKVYENYLDLNKTFIINRYYWGRRNFQYWIYKPLWERVFRHMRKRQPKILHFTWPLYGEQKILYHLNAKIVQTVHDPFPHSGQYTSEGEADRIEAFQHADSLVFLSTPQLGPFCMHYNVDKSKVLLNRMGEFDHLKLLSHSSYNDVNNPYILYIGQIQEHKGIDILLKSMLKLHQSHPEVKLIIAGKGNFPFDISPYTGLDYIEFRNYYVKVEEMVELLSCCKFAVCPYKDATQSGVVQTAFSLNTPLIVTNVGDLPLSVLDGVTGKVVPPCDVDALADAMREMIEHQDLLIGYKENIERIWKKEQNWTPIAKKYIDNYHKLLSNNM